MATTYDDICKIADFIRHKVDLLPTIGIICGSGLGTLADVIQNQTILPYKDIPGFPTSTVLGHKGNLIFGILNSQKIIVMQGRFHMYEGYNSNELAIPIRVMKILGVHTLLVSNAAGALNEKLNCGDFVIIKDHISLPGLSLNNILVGPNDEKFGPRFPPMSDAYDSQLRKLALNIAKEIGIEEYVHEGVYVHCGGPTYESPAECRMLKMMGADVVGMSTVPEIVIARHCGIRVFAVSLVTNISVLDQEDKVKADHNEVLLNASRRAEVLQNWLTQLISHLPPV